MAETIIEYLCKVTDNHYLIVAIISVIPFIEMRGALILASGMRVNQFLAVVFCWLASSLVTPIVMLTLKPLFNFLKKQKLLGFIARIAENSLTKKSKNSRISEEKEGFRRYFWLALLVAIPLPLTGVWSGSTLAAFLNFDNKKSCIAIMTGNLIATCLVAVIVRLTTNYINIVFGVFVGCIAFSVLIAVIKTILQPKY